MDVVGICKQIENQNDDSIEHYPLLLKDDPWQPNLKSALKSAYYEFLGKEPEFTNYSKIKDKDPFIDTLDYIWLSDHWQVKEVLPLPTPTITRDAGSPYLSSRGGKRTRSIY